MYLRWSWRGIRLILAMCVWFKMFYFWNWPLSKLHYFWSPGIPPQHTHTHTHTENGKLVTIVNVGQIFQSGWQWKQGGWNEGGANCKLPPAYLDTWYQPGSHHWPFVIAIVNSTLFKPLFKKKGQSLLNVYFLKKKEKHAASSYHNK